MLRTENPNKKKFVFVLLKNFSMISFASCIEPLRLANQYSPIDHYEWKLFSEDGQPVRCSNGTLISVDSKLTGIDLSSTIIVCGGIKIHDAVTRPILNWLRRESRRASNIGAVCTASHVLAKAGLLEGRQATIHWENQDSFIEEFENTTLTKSVFTVDGNRMTTAGGIASIDLMLRLIAEDHGQDLANTVADQLIYSSIRTDRDILRLSTPTRIGVRHPKLSSVIHKMEENIEYPVSPSILAKEEGMSTRQLERLFRRYLNRSPKKYYMELRLQKARNLLMQTEMSIINVALACGFSSPSHFSKCYRAQYNTTPYRERGSHFRNSAEN
ncbi:MAG: GlxA family transcriptional regulator [Albidovulum sp.]|nr:GlxA family transcriptional regulator [Albidovulum sp.]MDE0305507.1 GlxA family transcriptional regulator [Albidovulum sp.]MDE0533410.1 GlxA family transcriptional regulator [Albidovulum sp.]